MFWFLFLITVTAMHSCAIQPSFYTLMVTLACCVLCACDGIGTITNNVGSLYTYQHARELHFTLDLTQYTDNALQLIDNMHSVSALCNETLLLHSCDQLVGDLRYNVAQLNRDIIYIKTHKNIQR